MEFASSPSFVCFLEKGTLKLVSLVVKRPIQSRTFANLIFPVLKEYERKMKRFVRIQSNRIPEMIIERALFYKYWCILLEQEQ